MSIQPNTRLEHLISNAESQLQHCDAAWAAAKNAVEDAEDRVEQARAQLDYWRAIDSRMNAALTVDSA